MLDLSSVTLICAASIVVPETIKSFERCKAVANFGAVKLLTDVDTDYEHAIKIPRGLLQWPAHPGGKAAGERTLGGAQICDARPGTGQQNRVDCRTSILPPIIGQNFIFGAQSIEVCCALPHQSAAGHGRLVAGRLMSIKGAGNTSRKQQRQQQEGGHKKGATTEHGPLIARSFEEKPVSV